MKKGRKGKRRDYRSGKCVVEGECNGKGIEVRGREGR